MAKRVRVFVIDDSAVVRKVVSAILNSDAGIEVIGVAPDPLFARQKMEKDWPDVVLLDIEMPRMDGISFLRQLMVERPTPVVICSTLTERGASKSVEALAAGAVEVIAKPKIGVQDFLNESASHLVRALKTAAGARVLRSQTRKVAAGPTRPAVSLASTSVSTSTATANPMAATTSESPGVVAIGTSTGGTQALQRVLMDLPSSCPPLLVVQHMPEKFTAAFAQRLDQCCRCRVREAKNGDRVVRGQVLIAPGNRHMRLKKTVSEYRVDVSDGPPVNRHKPSVDVLFRSVARHAGAGALGIIMTGMGNDGARGLLEMHEAGAITAAQDEETSVVFGMPKEAIKLGATSNILRLDDIAPFILRWRLPSSTK